MTFAYIIFDVVILVLFAIFAIRGASRGLLLSLCGLAAVIIAFVGASFMADLLAPRVASALEPKFAHMIELRLNEQLQSTTPSTGDLALPTPTPEGTPAPEGSATPAPIEAPLTDVLNVLKDMGLYKDLVATIDKAVQDGMTEVAAGAAASVAAAIAKSVAYMIIFTASFAVILLFWTVLSHALDLVTRLPGLNTLNRTGGALFGLLKCCIILFLAAWLLRYSGNLIPEETVEKTHLLKFFLTTNPLKLLMGT